MKEISKVARTSAGLVTHALVWRELLRECRHRSHFIGRTVFVILLGLLVCWRWLDFGALARGTVQAQFARYGAQLFMVWALAQYVALVAFSTVRSGTLAEERATGSLPLARITRLGDRGVIMGWFASVLGRAVFTMALALPVLIMARSYGGFTLRQVALVSAVSLAAAAWASALTLAFAALSPSSGFAVAASAALQVLWFLLTLSLGMWWRWGALNALAMVFFVGGDLPYTSRGIAFLVCGRLALTVAFLWWAALLLSREVPKPGRRVKGLLVSLDRFFLRLARGRQLLWRGGLGPCRGNPVLWRERAVSPAGQRDHVIRFFYLPLLVMIVVLGVIAPLGGYRLILHILGFGLAVIPLVVFGLVSVVGLGAGFARERQQGTMSLLAVTPMSGRTIVLGKYFFGLRLLWVPAAMVGLLWAFLFYVSGREALDELFPFLLFLAMMPLVLAQLVYVGSAARTTFQAMGAGVVLMGGTLLLLVTNGFGAVTWGGISTPTIALTGAVLFFAVRRSAHGVIGRTALALVTTWSLTGFFGSLNLYGPYTGLGDWWFSRSRKLGFGPYWFQSGLTLRGLVLLFALLGLVAWLFLRATSRQLDGLMGRNG